MSNEYAEAMIAFANEQDQLNKPYKLGARGPNAFDCVGLMYAAARAAGLDASVFPNSWTVRNLTGWAEANGYLHLAADGYAGERGDLFLWGKLDGDHRPVKGAGHVGLVKRAPTDARPKGRAISAYNPELDIINHAVLPKPGGHLALYGFIALPYPRRRVQPVEVEETPAPTESVEPADDEPPIEAPTVEDLQAKIAAAISALS
jgi:hypothetical protein